MFLVDTNVLSERRKGPRADPGVVDFIDRTGHEIFLPLQVIGELFTGARTLNPFRADAPPGQPTI
jgi:predicted nucleic acid-binding protein